MDGRGDTDSASDFRRRRRLLAARRRQQRTRRILLTLGVLVCLCVGASAIFYAFSHSVESRTGSKDQSSASDDDASVKSDSRSKDKTNLDKEKETTVEAPPPQASCDGMRVQVGKDSPLPETYAPQDLGSLLAAGIPTNGGEMYLRTRAIAPLAQMISDANAAGEELVVISAYRSYADQQATFAHYSSIYGPGEVEMVSAPPGQSQHQLGTTVDFSNAVVGYQLLPAFGDTTASAWLKENAWRYGYVNTYPEGDQAGTGRQYEAWEYRFVGRETAREIQDEDMSLRTFLKEQGYPPRC